MRVIQLKSKLEGKPMLTSPCLKSLFFDIYDSIASSTDRRFSHAISEVGEYSRGVNM